MQRFGEKFRLSRYDLASNIHRPPTRERRRLSPAAPRDPDGAAPAARSATYWQLPGGGLLAGEQPEHGVLRELYEETRLLGRVGQPLFTIPYKYGFSSTYVVAVDAASVPVLGSDPEEQHAEHRKLVAIAWQPVARFPDNPELIEVRRWLARQ